MHQEFPGLVGQSQSLASRVTFSFGLRSVYLSSPCKTGSELKLNIPKTEILCPNMHVLPVPLGKIERGKDKREKSRESGYFYLHGTHFTTSEA